MPEALYYTDESSARNVVSAIVDSLDSPLASDEFVLALDLEWDSHSPSLPLSLLSAAVGDGSIGKRFEVEQTQINLFDLELGLHLLRCPQIADATCVKVLQRGETRVCCAITAWSCAESSTRRWRIKCSLDRGMQHSPPSSTIGYPIVRCHRRRMR